ncbi:MAG: hypothetical protein ABIE70_00590 [bacterium]
MLPGRYLADHKAGFDELLLLQDGTYVSPVVTKDGERHSDTGEWIYDGEDLGYLEIRLMDMKHRFHDNEMFGYPPPTPGSFVDGGSLAWWDSVMRYMESLPYTQCGQVTDKSGIITIVVGLPDEDHYCWIKQPDSVSIDTSP